MHYRTILFLAFISHLSLYFFSCSKQDVAQIDEILVDPQLGYANVDQRLWTYFAIFESEALTRGLRLNLNDLNIVGAISNIEEQGVVGYCEYGSHINNEITIDNQFWNRADEVSREFVVFHELGHCVLMRDHNELSNPDGTCLSIMRSGLGKCRDNYSIGTRSDFLDELFSNHNL